MEIMFETERLTVRKFRDEDAGKLYENHLDDEVRKWFPNECYADIDEAQDAIRFYMECVENEHLPYVLGVELKETKELIGDTGISEVDGTSGETEIGYCIGERYRGKGYATELLIGVTDFVASRSDIRKIYGRVVHGNDASSKVLEKSGYRFVKEEFDAEDDPYGNGMLVYMKEFIDRDISGLSGEENTMELISDYMRDDTYRHMLNELARNTFGIDFESWVTQGYFEGDYIPYSFMDEGKIVSNVSANRMKYMQNGSMRYYVQIGTVMTDEGYRKQGLAAKLMKHVIEEYEQECDGIYLFGDLSAAGFYQKMQFKIENQYRYYVMDEFCRSDKTKAGFKPIMNMGDEIKKNYLDLVRNSAYHSSFEQINKYGLQMFYTAGLDNVFYADDIDCFIVLDQDECVVLQSVLCKEKVALTDVVQRIDLADQKCRLGFTPHDADKEICISELYDGGDDYRLFYRGKELESIEREKLYFPDLSHA